MPILRDKPRILHKVLIGTGLLVAASVLSLSGFFLFRHQTAFQDQFRLRGESLAGYLAEQCQFALLVEDRAELERIAKLTLAGDRDVSYVVIENEAGERMAGAARTDLGRAIPKAAKSLWDPSVRMVNVEQDGVRSVEVTKHIAPKAEADIFGLHEEQPEILGRVRLALSLRSQEALFQSTLRQVAGIAALILLCSFLLGYVQIRKLLRPLVELAHVARLVGRGDFEGTQAVKESDDEVGDLVDTFNEMVHQVAERTHELRQQVVAKEQARSELAEAQQRLMDLSRQSGMAEIASSVLHNVGNVLNSVNVSATLAAVKMKESRVGKLAALNEMLHANVGALDAFLRDDPKGQRVLPYLGNLCKHFAQERESVLMELEQLTSHVGHIKQIVSTQQSYARVSGVTESFDLQELAEDAIRIVEAGNTRRHINLHRDFEQTPMLHSDKHQILQILLNLLRNAQQAIEESGRDERLIRVRIRRHGEGRIQLEVKDSGIGLSSENLTRIFAHGFTTKKSGHGFGLHSGALAAKNLGGALWAESDGPGRGAAFTLELPLDRRHAAPKEAAGATVEVA